MPSRIVREGILTSESVCSLAWAEEVFYRRLMSVVDDHGRFHAIPKLLRAACYPLQIDKVSDSDIGKWTTACVAAGLVRVYPAQDGKRYIEIVKFGQQVRSKSKFPPPIDIAREQPIASDSNCNQPLSDAHLDVSVSVDDKAAVPAFVLPDWIPAETWAAYCKVRTGKKAKNEPHALGLIVKDLEKFRGAGHDPVEVLNNSIKSGWAGVFEPKTKPTLAPAQQPESFV